MKNVINFLVVVLILVATEIQAYDKYTIGGRTWEYDINNSSAEIVSVSPEPKNGEDIVIPKKINGYPVKTIGSRMGVQGTFGNCDGITRFEIPEFITRIDSCAFAFCKNLACITIPRSVKQIGEGAFSYCGKLKQINVDPDNINYTTENGVLLTKDKTVLVSGINGDVVIPDAVKRIGKEAFCGCRGLTNVTIPKSVIEIGASAFEGCTNLTEITIPSSVKAIGEEAFKECTGLRRFRVDAGNPVYASENGLLLSKDKKILVCGINGNVIIPNTVTVIGSHAFDGCEGWDGSCPLRSVKIPDSVIEIGESAFEDCKGLKDIAIPNSVTKICDKAFAGCRGLNKVKIGSGVRSIGKEAFSWCKNLTGVTIPDSVIDIDKSAFERCEKLASVRIGKGVKVISGYVFEDSGLESVEIPSSVTRIEAYAFVGCTNLVSVKLDKNSTHVADDAFRNCTKLGQGGFIIIGGKLSGYNGTTGNVVIPVGTTEIGAEAFRSRKDLTSVTIPNTVKKIGKSAFKYCSGLTSITIPDSVTEIGEEAFYDCDALRSVTLGKGVVRLGPKVFSSCKNLQEIKVDENNNTYASENGLLLSKDKRILFCGCNGDVVIPKTVSSIGDHAFYFLVNLKNVEFPNSLNDIGERSFHCCRNLRSVTFPDSLTSIGDGAFCACMGLTKVRIPNNVTSIGEGAFEVCRNLEDVMIGDGVENVEKKAFADCGNLKKISIPEAFASEIPFIFSDCPILDEVNRGNAWINMRHDVKVAYREYYIDEAARGVPRAQYCLGVCYINGDGVVSDGLKGMKLLLQAARQGHAGAQYKVGAICFAQQDAKGYANAFDWWSRAAKKGHYQAIFSLKLIPTDIRNRR